MQHGVIVIGGGAAGMMASISAAENGADVLLIEKNKFCGMKVGITGKGRCNVTNDCTEQEFLQNVPTNPRFLYAAIAGFSTADTKDFFENAGVPLKTERGKRIFPQSDRARDIVRAMVAKMEALGVTILTAEVTSILTENGKAVGVIAGGKAYNAKAVILCTGGKSYSKTGSDGRGYLMASAVGHSIVELKPSLVPIVADEKFCKSLQGLSLKNVGLRIVNKTAGKVVFEDFGEMMFTHFGLTGPMVLSASSHIKDINSVKYTAYIDLKPALDEKTLDARLLSDFARYANHDFINALNDLLPSKMIEPFVALSGIEPHKKVNLITREERKRIVLLLKGISVELVRFRPIEEAIITSGGIDVREVSPKTMESKLISGLYFAGEILDVDAYTGGFNLQIAWSTGAMAGKNAAWSI